MALGDTYLFCFFSILELVAEIIVVTVLTFDIILCQVHESVSMLNMFKHYYHNVLRTYTPTYTTNEL